jgi:hypothetical protein
MDPLVVTGILVVVGIGLLFVGSAIRGRSLVSLDRRRRLERERRGESGRIGWILLWLLGVPIPVLLVLYLLRGCT